MNWLAVADFVKSKTCDENRRYGRCCCRTRGKRAVNPCAHANTITATAEALDSLSFDDADISALSGDMDSVRRWVVKHTCYASQQGQPCQHRGCMHAETLLDWIDSQRPQNNLTDPRKCHAHA